MDATDAAPPTQASEVEKPFRQIMDESDAADAAPPTQASEVEEPFSTRMAKYRAHMERIIHYKKTRIHVPGLTFGQKRKVRRQYRSYVLSDGTLYFLVGGKKALEVVTSEDRVHEVLHQYHSNGMGGHHGINNTRTKIRSHYIWPHMSRDVREFVTNCATCQEMKKPQPQPEPDLLSIINNTETPPRKRKTPRRRRRANTVNKGTMCALATEAEISAEDIDKLISTVDMDMQTSATVQTSATIKTSAVDKGTQTSAVDSETQKRPEQTEPMSEYEHFWKSLLPSLAQFDEMENMQFRIDVEQLVLTRLSQVHVRRAAAVSSVAPHTNPAAFPGAWYHNMDMDHNYCGHWETGRLA